MQKRHCFPVPSLLQQKTNEKERRNEERGRNRRRGEGGTEEGGRGGDAKGGRGWKELEGGKGFYRGREGEMREERGEGGVDSC